MSQLSGKVALVTGASSGLGAVVAQVFAERGASVFGIARRGDEMATVFENVPGGKYASVDISSSDAWPTCWRPRATSSTSRLSRVWRVRCTRRATARPSTGWSG